MQRRTTVEAGCEMKYCCDVVLRLQATSAIAPSLMAVANFKLTTCLLPHPTVQYSASPTNITLQETTWDPRVSAIAHFSTDNEPQELTRIVRTWPICSPWNGKRTKRRQHLSQPQPSYQWPSHEERALSEREHDKSPATPKTLRRERRRNLKGALSRRQLPLNT